MLHQRARLSETVAGTIGAATRATRWQLVGELPLTFDAYHPQGMARIGSTWWISTVDIAGRRGLVLAVDELGNLIERIPVGDPLSDATIVGPMISRDHLAKVRKYSIG